MTNDDGVKAPGLASLAAALVGDGHEVVVVGPLEDRSGMSAAIGPIHLDKSVDYERLELGTLPGVPVFGIDGLPALAVLVSFLEGFGPAPDLVASGINRGFNTGRSVVHSGTVGAALTAANFGSRAVAVSIGASEEHICWDSAAALAALVVRQLEAAPPRTVVNLNVPNRSLGDLAGIRRGRLSSSGTVQSTVADGGGRLRIDFGAPTVHPKPDTDSSLVSAGYASLTPLAGVTEATGAEVATVMERLLGILAEEGIA